MSQAAAVRAEFRARLESISTANGYQTDWNGVLHFSEVKGTELKPPLLVFTPLPLRATSHRPGAVTVTGRYAVEAIIPWSPTEQDLVDQGALDIQRAIFASPWQDLLNRELEELDVLYPETGKGSAVVSLTIACGFVERY